MLNRSFKLPVRCFDSRSTYNPIFSFDGFSHNSKLPCVPVLLLVLDDDSCSSSWCDGLLASPFHVTFTQTLTYSRDHRFHTDSLHLIINFVRFRKSRLSIWWGFNSGRTLGLMFNMELGVRTGSSTSSSI